MNPPFDSLQAKIIHWAVVEEQNVRKLVETAERWLNARVSGKDTEVISGQMDITTRDYRVAERKRRKAEKKLRDRPE